jgi:hypothetical protein
MLYTLLYFVVRLDLIEGHSIRLYKALRHAKHVEDAGSDTKNNSTYNMHKFLTTHGSSRSFVLERPCALSRVGLEGARYVESNLWVQRVKRNREVFIA